MDVKSSGLNMSQSNHDTRLSGRQLFAKWGAASALVCLLSVAVGAFAAHGLKASFSPYQLSIVETAAKYQMYHGLAMLVVSAFMLVAKTPLLIKKWLRVNQLLLMGVFVFCGSLYGLAITGFKGFAYATPFGGVLFISAWAYLAFSCYRIRNI